MADSGTGGGSNYKLSATLELQDLLSGKLSNAASKIKSLNGAVSKLGSNGEVSKLAQQFDALKNLRQQVEQFKQIKKAVVATRQAYEQANAATAKLAQQYRQGQSAVAQLQAKHDDLKKSFDISQSATAQLKDKISGLTAEAAKAKTSGAVAEYQRLQNQIKATSAELKASQAMTKSTGAELKTLAGGVKQAQQELKSIGSAFEQSKNKARQLKRELQSQESALSGIRRSLNSQGFSTKDFADSDIALRRRMAETAQRLYDAQRIANLRGALSSSSMTLPTRAGNIRVNVTGNANSTLGKIKSELNALTQKSWNIAVNTKNAISGNTGEVANGVLLGMGAQVLGIAGIGYGLADALKSQMGFEKQMSAVQAVLGYDKSQMGSLTAAAEQIGYTTKFTAEEAGKAQYYAAMAGWKEPQIISGARGITNLAAAGDTDLRRTADVVTDLVTAFGLTAGENLHFEGKPVVESTQHFVDSMAAMITNSNTDIEQSYEALKYSAPAVRAMYADQSAEARANAMRDSFVITGLMANAAVKGSMAGTSQRALYTRLASENRNAYFAERALPVSLIDQETGQVRRLRDVISDFREKFNNGLDPEAVTEFAEAISGEKIHADTRRKLNSFIENVQKNGGKMTGADRLKITSMLAGQEAMSGWLSVLLASEQEWNNLANAIDNCEGRAEKMANIQMDNLSGDVALLASAWDAFARNLLKGDASAGLREFTQGFTGVLTTANNLFKDGIQLGDFFKIGTDAISRLKNKFLELDGIGSLLAGGALFMGLKKILSMALSVKDTLSTWSKIRTMSDLGGVIRGNQGIGGVASTVGTMHVTASMVNVNGPVRGTPTGPNGTVASGGAGGKPPTTGGIVTAGTNGRPPTTGGLNTVWSRNQPATSGGFNPSVGAVTAGTAAASSILVSNRNGSNVRTLETVNNVRQETLARQNSAYVENYYARRGMPPPSVTPTILPPPTTATGAASNIRANLGGIGAGVVLAGLFSAIDIYATRNRSQMSNAEVAQMVEYERTQLVELRKQNASQGEISYQMQKIRQAEINQEEVKFANTRAERTAETAAFGMVAGTTLGAAVGSIFPVVGTMLGGMIGGVLGQWGGSVLSEYANNQEEQRRKEIQNIPVGSVSEFRRMDEENLAQYRDEGYQNQLAQEKKERDAREVERVFKENAEGIRRHHYADYLERHDIEPNELPSGDAVRRHSLHGGKAADDSEVRAANFRYEQDHARMEYLARQRERYNKEWQQRFGGTSLAGQPKFIPIDDKGKVDERGIELLARYDEERVNKERRQNLIDGVDSYLKRQNTDKENPKWYEQKYPTEFKTTQQAAEEARATSSHAGEKLFESVGNKFASFFPSTSRTDYSNLMRPDTGKNGVWTSPLGTPSVVPEMAKFLQGVNNFLQNESSRTDYSSFTRPSTGENEVGTSPLGTPSAVTDTSKLFQSVGNFFDNLLFNKAAAGAITPETNLQISTPPTAQETIQANQVQPATTIQDLNTLGVVQAQLKSDTTNLVTDLSAVSESINAITQNISTSLNETFSGITETVSTFTSTLGQNLTESFSGIGENFSAFTAMLGESFTQSFSGITENISTFATTLGESFNQIPIMATNAFSMITTAASEGWMTIQAEWGQVPAFFEGLWAGAGAAASAAGSAIATGLTSVIGGIIGAWQSAASTVSGIISSIASMAASAASALPSFGGVGANATGTASWRGGFTEINEQGGEIIDLPQGTRIYPHATTMKLLQRDIAEGKLNAFIPSLEIGHNATGTASWRGGLTQINEQGGEIVDLPSGLRLYPQSTMMKLLQNNIVDNGASEFAFETNQFSLTSPDALSTFPEALKINDLVGGISLNSSSTASSTQNNNGVNVTGNTFNIRKDSDINEIAFKLFELMSDSNANYAGA